MAPDADIPYGTLDLMVLKTLDVMSPQNGYAIARRIEQIARGSLALNQGTIYPALLRLEQKGWIGSEWGTSVPWPRTSRTICPRFTVSTSTVARSIPGAAGFSFERPRVMPPTATTAIAP